MTPVRKGLLAARRPRRVAVLACISAATLAAALLPGHAVEASTQGSAQTVTATVVAGTLTVAAPPALATNLTPGQTNSGIALGSLVYTNTLNDGSSWSVTATSNDWTSLLGGNIPFSGMSIAAGGTINGAVGSTGTPSAGAGGTLTGTDTTPGTTQSNPVTLATGTSSVQGVYTQTGSTISVTVPGGTATGVYTGSITYTITG